MEDALQEKLLQAIKQLRPGTTICPGQLARNCGHTLAQARPTLLALAREGKVVISQRGERIAREDLERIRGPFRVGTLEPANIITQ